MFLQAQNPFDFINNPESSIAASGFTIVLIVVILLFILRNPQKIKVFWENTLRVFRVARRPTAKEVELIARVSGVGILIVGGAAFGIQILGNLVATFFRPETAADPLGALSMVVLVSGQALMPLVMEWLSLPAVRQFVLFLAILA